MKLWALLAYALLFSINLVLISCGKPMQAAKTESTGGGNGNSNGGVYPTPTPAPIQNGVSCSLSAGVPTYTNAPLTLTVNGNVDRVTVDGQLMGLPDPTTHTLLINYAIVLPGAKTVNAVVQNTAAGTSGSCATSFVAPSVADDRKTVAPSDAGGYRYPADVFITDNNNTTFRYLFMVSKSTGQGYYNSISLDPLTKPGQIDAWTGWKLIPGQAAGTGTLFPIVVTKYSDNSYFISAINFDGAAYATLATCNAGSCTFSAWSAY